MGKIGFFDDALEQLEEGVKQQAKAAVQSFGSQTGVQAQQQSQQSQSPQPQQAPSDIGGSGTNESAKNDPSQMPHAVTDEATKHMVSELYEPSVENMSPEEQAKLSELAKQKLRDGFTPEEIQSLEALRKKLHDETYYIPLTQRKPHEVGQHEEEQKKEEEKMEDLQKKEEKKQKNQPMDVQMGANRAERFPGASG